VLPAPAPEPPAAKPKRISPTPRAAARRK